MNITRENVKDEQTAQDLLRLFSLKYGGAWAYSVHWNKKNGDYITTFEQFKSPCSVPDCFQNKTSGFSDAIGWKGEVIEFSQKAKIREAKRGLLSDL